MAQQVQSRADQLFLEVGVDRGYLSREQAARVQAEVEETGRPAEQLVEKLGILSRRRVQRLANHVRYRSLRQCDKVYVRTAVRAGLIREADGERALTTQRERFEKGRERIRVGTLLVEWGLVRPEQDRELAARITTEAAARETDSSVGSGSGVAPADSSAVKAVETPRPPARPLEGSSRAGLRESRATPETPPAALLDSAADYEDACARLARKRVEGGTRESGSRTRESGSRTRESGSKPRKH